MKTSEIYKKTFHYNSKKLGLAAITAFVAFVLFGGVWLIVKTQEPEIMTAIGLICGAFLLAVGAYYFIMVRYGYRIKISHLAIIERALDRGEIPKNPTQYAQNALSERFGSKHNFYKISRDLSLSTSQIMSVFKRGFSLEDVDPDFRLSKRFRHMLSFVSLGCAEECCLAYSLRQRDYEVHAACVDALTILAQGLPRFFSKAFRTSITVLGICFVFALLVYIPGHLICASLDVALLTWVVATLFLTVTFKIAILDGWILARMVRAFFEISSETKIDRKNYKKLDAWSKTYAKLRLAAENAAQQARAADLENAQEEETEIACTDAPADEDAIMREAVAVLTKP